MDIQLNLGEISVDVVQKDIKNVHLSVHPPTGRVRIAAPRRMKLDAIRVFAISKLAWIKRQQIQFQSQERETPREYLDRESHYLWGRRFLLRILETNGPQGVEINHRKLVLSVRPEVTVEEKHAIMSRFYREEMRAAIPPLLSKWVPAMRVTVDRLYLQKMKTKWGSCNPRAHTIRLNTELAKKPRQFLEYVVVHELAHLLVPRHNERFKALLDDFLPQWRLYSAELNRWPIAHSSWD